MIANASKPYNKVLVANKNSGLISNLKTKPLLTKIFSYSQDFTTSKIDVEVSLPTDATGSTFNTTDLIQLM